MNELTSAARTVHCSWCEIVASQFGRSTALQGVVHRIPGEREKDFLGILFPFLFDAEQAPPQRIAFD